MNSSLNADSFTSGYGLFQGEQQPLMAMVEITNKCNMACPVCFADSCNQGIDISLQIVKRKINRLHEVAGLVPLQLSGGEPTLHPHLLEIVEYARESGFRNIELVTNGIIISRKPDYLKKLVNKGLSAVYLQFDGLQTETYLKIRGCDMGDIRRQSIAVVRDAGICCTLAVAVVRGVNDGEIGDIVNFAIENIDTVRAVNFQSATRFSGRFIMDQKRPGYSVKELKQLICNQTGIAPEGFLSRELGHPECNAMSLVFVVDGKLKPLFQYLSRESIASFLGENKRSVILDLFMGKEKFGRKHLLNPKMWKLLQEGFGIFGQPPGLRSILDSKHILLFAKSFMERGAMDDERIDRCNYAIAEADEVYSFCAFNNIHRCKGG